MPEQISALIVILTIASTIFFIAKKHLIPYVGTEEFTRWRNTWLIITLLAFLSNNFWLFLVATAIFVWHSVKKIENRFAFFAILVLAVPGISARMGPLIDIDYVRLLSLVILLPMFLSTKWRTDTPRFGRAAPDYLLFLLIILMTLLRMRGTTVTDALRWGLGFSLVTFLPYFVASRSLKDFKQIKVAIIALVLAGLIAGSIGIFEYLFRWIVYHPLEGALNANFPFGGGYLARGNNLRAISSLAQPLVLGLVMVVTFGLYLFVAPSIENKWIRRLCLLAVLVGLIAPLTRGAWVAAAALYMFFVLLDRKVAKKMAIALVATTIVAASLPVIPGGQKIINLLPFVGNVDSFNADYRDVLVVKGIQIVMRKPLFGVFEPSLEPEMEDMVQGEGIVDIVNSYLNIVLANGLPGLTLFVGLFLLAIYRVLKSRKKIKDKTSEEYLCGQALVATMGAILIQIYSTSFIGMIPTMTYTLAGIMFAYARVINAKYKRKPIVWN